MPVVRLPKPSSPEFRREAVARIRDSGKSIRDISAEFGVSYRSLRSWRKREQTDLDDQGDELTTDERAEVRELLHDAHEAGQQTDPPA
jgi:transposase